MTVADPYSPAVLFSAILTGVSRRKLRTAPMHVFTGPPGSGKTEFAEFVAHTTSSRDPARLHIGDDQALFRALQDRVPVVIFDGLTGLVDWPTLARVLSQPTWTFNGKTVSTDAMFLACGQDPDFSDAMAETAVIARMVAPIPRELMTSPDVILGALRQIQKVFAEKGMPGMKSLTPFGGFRDWSNQVRAPLVALGMGDPVMTQVATLKEMLAEGIRAGLLPAGLTEEGLEARLVAAGAKPTFIAGVRSGYDLTPLIK